MRNLLIIPVLVFFTLSLRGQVVPSASIVGTSSLLCTNVPIRFSAASNGTGALSYTWAVVPVKGLTNFTDLNSPTVSLTFNTIINYTVYLNIADNTGLTSISYTTITAGRSSNSSFNATFNATGYPTQLVLTNYSTNSSKSYWRFSGESAPDSSYNTVKNYPVSGNYTVTLETFGEKGCNDISTYSFRISDSSSVQLPNIFTPNGDDANDVFRPITRGITGLNAWVYNRYGVLVCRWDKVKGFWDGHSTSGEECSDGEYIVLVEAYGFDGKVHKLKSTITLVR